MPLIPPKQHTANKNNICYGIILILTVMSAILRSPMSAQASPIEQYKADSQPNSQPDLFLTPSPSKQPAFGTKGQKHWYVQGAVATTLDRNEAFPQRFVLAGAGPIKIHF